MNPDTVWVNIFKSVELDPLEVLLTEVEVCAAVEVEVDVDVST